MMQFIELVKKRQSIRSYNNKPIPRAHLTMCLETARLAPSACNAQPWHFIVIDDRAILDEVPGFHPYAKFLQDAPVAICVCGDLEREKNKGLDYWVLDCAAAAENILLAAHSLGLGACWIGIHPRIERKEALGQLLKLPQHVIPFCLIALGYPDQTSKPSQRYKSSRIHFNYW